MLRMLRRTPEREIRMREIRDAHGMVWQALAVESVVAHGKRGSVLAFRSAEEPDADPLLTPVTFNSTTVAEQAIRTMGEKELQRRLMQTRIGSGTATEVRPLRR
jgi:hypothetical protein